MCKRGVRFNFEPNELVLCFEPDPTKAKVLYYAKILEQCASSKNVQGKRKADYMIHFQGWNSSWDRVVPESFVLKNNETNRALMRRLANIARQVKRNKTRKRRIDDILKRHFKRSRLDNSDTESTTATEEDDEGDEEDTGDDSEGDSRDGEEDTEEEQRRHNGTRDADDGEESEATTEQTDEDNDEEDEEDEDPEHRQHIDLELPENLRQKLEEDCMFINMQQKLINLPASPNIVTVLEGYVKNFGVNVLCATGEKQRNQGSAPPPERNISVCKELVDGLRVMFDFVLPTVLLYDVEKAQYESAMKDARSGVTPVKVKEENTDTVEPPTRSRRRSSQRLHTPPASSPKLPRLWPNTDDDEDHDDEDGGDDRDDDEEDEEHAVEEEEPPRRITRHSFHEEHHPPAPSQRKSRHDSGCRATRNSAVTTATTTANNNSSSRGLSERVTPPPPLLIPSHISSQASSCPSTPTQVAGEYMSKEAAVNNIFSWKLFQDDYKGGESTPPCMIYGTHHLLRLFVKLPDLLTEMRLPDITLKHLLRHLELFIDYLSSRSEEFFPDSVYVDVD